MEEGLLLNLFTIFQRHHIEIRILERYFGRILISIPKKMEMLAGKVLNFVFGIVSYSPILYIEKQESALRSALKNFLREKAIKGSALLDRIESKKVPLAITVRSSDDAVKREDFTAQCFEILQNEFPGVLFVQEWKKPVFSFEVEIRDLRYYIYDQKVEMNWRGLPIEDRSGAILNSIGTYNDIISALMVMKRGIHVLPLHFNILLENKNSRKKSKENKEIFVHLMKYYPKDVFFAFEIDHVQLMTRVMKKISKFLKNKPAYLANEKYYSCNMCIFVRNKITALFCKNFSQFLLQSLFEYGEEILDSNLIKVMAKNDRKKLLDALIHEQDQQNYASILKPHIIKYESIIVGDFEHSFCPFSLEMYYPLRALEYLMMFPIITFDPAAYWEKLRLIDPFIDLSKDGSEFPVYNCPFLFDPFQNDDPAMNSCYQSILDQLYALFDSESWFISILREGKFKKICG